MEIEPGMKFRGNKNGRETEIIRLGNGCVKYRDLKYGAVFSIGQATFEKCDITPINGAEIKNYELEFLGEKQR